MPAPKQYQGGESELDLLRHRCEEAELAAAVGMRRASAAEEEAAQLRARLEEAQKEAKDLGWQVCTVDKCAPLMCVHPTVHVQRCIRSTLAVTTPWSVVDPACSPSAGEDDHRSATHRRRQRQQCRCQPGVAGQRPARHVRLRNNAPATAWIGIEYSKGVPSSLHHSCGHSSRAADMVNSGAPGGVLCLLTPGTVATL